MKTPRSLPLQLVLEGHLDSSWTQVFEGLSVDSLENGETRVTGRIDQARLHGLFRVFRDRGVTIKSVNPVPMIQEDE